MPKKVNISALANKGRANEKRLVVPFELPTFAEATKSATLSAAFERAAHRAIVIDIQARMRANEEQEDRSKVIPVEQVVGKINWETLGSRVKQGLTTAKIELAYGELIANGDFETAQKALPLQKAGNMVELEKLLRAKAPKTFAPKVKKVTETPKAEAKK